MPDVLAVYGAVAGSAGLASLAWQIYTRRAVQKDRVSLDAYHFGRRLSPDDPGYERALRRTRERTPASLRQRLPDLAEEYGTSITVTNLSPHPIYIAMGGMIQEATDGDCTMFNTSASPVQPRTQCREFWIPDWWAEEEEGMDLRRHPIRAFVVLEHGPTFYSDPIHLFPPLPQRGRRASPPPSAKQSSTEC